MYVCIYVCVYISLFTNIYIYIYNYIYAYMRLKVYAWQPATGQKKVRAREDGKAGRNGGLMQEFVANTSGRWGIWGRPSWHLLQPMNTYTHWIYIWHYIYTYMIHISWGSPGGRECFLYKSISGTRCGRSSLLPRKAECCLFHPACSYFVLYHLVLDDGFYRPRISSWFESTPPIPNVDYPAASPSDSFVMVKDLFPCG
jgi:hypothetical protein